LIFIRFHKHISSIIKKNFTSWKMISINGKMKRSFVLHILLVWKTGTNRKNWSQFFIFSIQSKIMNLFSIGFGIWFQFLLDLGCKFSKLQITPPISSPDLHLLLFHKYSSNSSQTFQSFKISLIFLQHSFKIRIIPFSCIISCCFTLQIWKRNKRTGNWSHLIISQEWISSSFHQHLCNPNLILNWCLHERSPSILKMKSNLTIDDKRWHRRYSIFRYFEKR